MANFELRIYVIEHEIFDEIEDMYGVWVQDLTDEQIIEVAENAGTVYSFSRFLGLDCIAFDEDHVRAYFISVDNAEIPPIPADRYYTVIHADKIINHTGGKNCKEKILYEE